MIDKQNVLQASRSSRLFCPVVQRLTLAARHFKIAVVKEVTLACLPVALVIFTAPLSARAQNCSVSYEPGTPLQRVSKGLMDGRIGPLKVVNNTENATVISLYHPDAPKRVFKYWYAEPGMSYWLGTDHYSSDWGIQVDDGPICLVGRVASWDGQTFTTFPRRLLITDAPLAAVASSVAPVRNSRAAIALTPLPQLPGAYEAIALKQLTDGEIRGGLISLLRAADLYRGSGQTKEEKRVRDRIKQIRGS